MALLSRMQAERASGGRALSPQFTLFTGPSVGAPR